MSKKCHACNASVLEEHIGKCPKCGEDKGYSITREIEESVNINDSISAELKKIQPETISKTLELLAKRQESLTKSLSPLLAFQNSQLAKQLTAFQNSQLAKQLTAFQNSPMLKQISNLQKTIDSINLATIKIPKLKFTVNDILPKETKQKNFSADVIISNAAENKPDLKEALESKQQVEEYDKKLYTIEKQLGDLIEESKNSKDNLKNGLTDIATEQKNIANIINRKLSPTQTIGIALIVGTIASFLGSALFMLWT